MKLEQVQNWTVEELENDIAAGGKFVVFTYTISLLIVTLNRPSNIYYIKSDESSFATGWQYFLISLLLGWWGFPWGPIYTIGSLCRAFTGKDITSEVMSDICSRNVDFYQQPVAKPYYG